MIAAERETSLAFTDADEVVRVYTSRRADINALQRKGLEPTASGEYDGGEWATFEIPVARFKVASAYRPKREYTEEQRQIMSERMKKMQASRASES